MISGETDVSSGEIVVIIRENGVNSEEIGV